MSGHAEIDADLILQHSGFIRSLARGLLRDESLVDDVVQETLIKALEKGPRSPGALTAWLRTVTRNIAYKSYRGTARRKAREEEAAQPEQLTATVDIVARGEALESLTSSVMDLPESAREVVFLRYYEGLSHAEIGKQLGLAPGAVRMRLHRAQKLLQDRLDRRSGGDRAAWMSGLAGLAGLGLKDIGRGIKPTTTVTPTAALAAVAAGTVLCVGLGMAWLGTRPNPEMTEAVMVAVAGAEAEAADSADVTLDAGLRSAPARVDAELPVEFISSSGEAEASILAVPDDLTFPEGNLRGTVISREGEPVPDANVFAAWGREPMKFRTKTNAKGRFGIELPKPVFDQAMRGDYSVLLGATAESQAPTRVWAWPREGIDDVLGDKRALLRMRGPGGALSGVVMGADGRPIVGAQIRLGERTRLGIGFLGQQSALTENRLAPLLATMVSRENVPMFQGHRSMRGTLGSQVLEADGTRSRLLPATTRDSRADGSFRFGGVELGSHPLRITAPGYAPFNGTVSIRVGDTGQRTFTLESGATLRGTLTRSDGLAPTAGVVHVFHHNPYAVTTTRMKADGSFEIRDLRPGSVRVVAEERWPRQKSAPRITATGLELRQGDVQTIELEMHEPLMAQVRVLQQTQDGLMPAVNVSIELSAVQNPLDVAGVYQVDAEGRTQIPLETVRTVEWVITKGNRVKSTPSGQKLMVSEAAEATPIRRMPPPSRAAAVEELVITLGQEDLQTAPVLMSPQLAGAGSFDHRDGFALFQTGSPFTFVGWATPTPGVLRFNGVPSGNYHIIYPHHGMGWISSYTIHVGASSNDSQLDLGKVSLPALGYLQLEQDKDSAAAEATSWGDLDIKHLVSKEDGSGDVELAMFMGRVEVPTRISLTPGTYVLRDPSRPNKAPEWVTIKSGATVQRSWE